MNIKSRIISRRKMRIVLPGNGNTWENPGHFDTFPIISLIVGEIEPSIHTVKVRSKNYCRKTMYTLAFPYIQFFALKVSVGKIPVSFPFSTWRPKPLITMDQAVTPILLPNIYGNGKLCLGPGWDCYKNKLENIPSLFWNTEFSLEDYWPFKDQIRNTPLKSLTNWEKLTKKYGDPNFMLKLVDLKRGKTF